jgi:hypothetical protein
MPADPPHKLSVADVLMGEGLERVPVEQFECLLAETVEAGELEQAARVARTMLELFPDHAGARRAMEWAPGIEAVDEEPDSFSEPPSLIFGDPALEPPTKPGRSGHEG